MRDELDPVLLRHFSQQHEPLPADAFARQLAQLIHQQPAGPWRAALNGIAAGCALGIRSLARLRHAGLLAFAGAAVTLWALLT
jgi:thioesterase domain-containing protein